MDDYEDVKKVTEDLDRLLKMSPEDFYYIKGYVHGVLNRGLEDVIKYQQKTNKLIKKQGGRV